MNISTLCDKIELQSPVKEKVFAFAEGFDFQKIDELQKDYFSYANMKTALNQVRDLLSEDSDGIKILTCMLKACVDTYDIYQAKGISDDIYFATMKCFTRFINETHKMTGEFCFDRWWWTTRQAGCHLFRIGELEYEIVPNEKGDFIDLHIPSDADFSPQTVDKSLQKAQKFFAKYFPSLQNAEYRCHSWLLDEQLKNMLSANSNIVSFQNRFEIFDKGETDTEFIEWLFNTKSKDFASLPENTSLQKNVKKHLLLGGVIKNSYGRMIGDMEKIGTNIRPATDNLDAYIKEETEIDYSNENIKQLADSLFQKAGNEIEYIKMAYEFVRDNISHSADINEDKITCSASQVLNARHGICFAKSHLLAALLRYKSIPTGFCYQKLILDDETAPVLIYHGLNGVYISEQRKWIRLDARGNKDGVNAQFSLEREQFAFPIRPEKGEIDGFVIYPTPDKEIVERLKK